MMMKDKLTMKQVVWVAIGAIIVSLPVWGYAQRSMDVQTLPGLTSEAQRKDAQSGEILDRKVVEVGAKQLQEMIALGDKLWHSRDVPMSGNGQACNMCHADGSVTHPETYPKYKPQLGHVATIQEMMGWCIAIPNQGKPYALGSKEMNALEAYMNWNNRGQVMEIGAAPSSS
jgi:prepilin-type processing-associated H-X9-DG protein